MINATTYDVQAVPSLHHAPSSLHSDPDKQGKTGVRVVEMPIEAATLFWAVGPVFQEVRMETSGLLHEISSDTHMVELLMRR